MLGRLVLRRALLALAFLVATFALALVVTGGFVISVTGVRVSARSPVPAALLGLLALATWGVLASRARAIAADFASIDAWLRARAVAIVVAMAGIAGAVAIFNGSFSATGSDGSGYLSHALMLGRGQLARPEPLTALADWRDAALILTPLGWRPALEPGLQVPTYPVGLALLMAPLHLAGGTIAACLIVPLSFFVAVLATGALAHRLSGRFAAILAAAGLATSPIALIEAMQPMSDVPVTACWLLCWLFIVIRTTMVAGSTTVGGSTTVVGPGFSRASLGGSMAAVAVLIRPNLAPLAAVPALYLLCARLEQPIAIRVRTVGFFSAPVAIAGLVIAMLQWHWFGSPLRSGHGTAGELFAPANFIQNAVVYTRWLLDTHGLWLLAAPLALVFVRGREMRWLLSFAGLVLIAYFIYGVFDVWTYLRFLLPSIAIAMIAVASVIAALVAKLRSPLQPVALALAVLALAATQVASAREHGVFRLRDRDARVSLSGRYLEAVVPSQGVIVAGEESGALRYYTNRSIVRWDVATPDTLPGIGDRLVDSGYDVWIALDDWEEELFRGKFPGTTIGALDWPPAVDAGTEIRTRAWRLRDRERFMRGERVSTDRLH